MASAGGGGGGAPPAPSQWAPPPSGLPVATYAPQQWPSEKAPPPQIWGEGAPPHPQQQQQQPQPFPQQQPQFAPLPYPQQPMYLAGGGFQPQWGNGAPQIIVMGPGGMVPMALLDGIPQDFADAGRTSSCVVSLCALLTLSLAAAALGTPWALTQVQDGVALSTCSLAYGLTSFGLLGSDCGSPPQNNPLTPTASSLPRWPTPYTGATLPDKTSGVTFQNALWVDAWLAVTVLVFLLGAASAGVLSGRYARAPAQDAPGGEGVPRLHFGTVRVLESLTAVGAVASWVSAAWGITFFNNLRALYADRVVGVGSGQIMVQAMLASSVIAAVTSSRLKCGIRSLAQSRTPETCVGSKSLL